MYPIVRKIITLEQKKAVIEAAKKDNDKMLFPTHALLKDDKIIGGWCLDGIPLVLLWHDSNAVKMRDSLVLTNTIDAIMNDRGTGGYMIACNSRSPYYPHMEKGGFKPVWSTNIFYKNINSDVLNNKGIKP